jgi:hypothetical protein
MSAPPDATRIAIGDVPKATVKEKFDLGIQMLKGYYDALESRAERTAVLLVGVVGWLIASPSSRESLTKYRPLFYGAILGLTVFLVMTGFNISHFIKRFREVQSNVEDLNYAEPKDFTRYRMPPRLHGIPVFLIYMSPILVLYVLILLLLFYVRFKLPAVDSTKPAGPGL